MNWKDLTEESQLASIREESNTTPVVIFKHSTRCSISSVAKSRIDRSNAPAGIAFYYLDLIKYRNISNKIVELFGIHHESPQVLLLRNGECVYDDSHGSIAMDEIMHQAGIA